MDFKTPAEFGVYDELNNVAHRWERYVKTVKIYLAVKEINATHVQGAILLDCAGRDVQDIAKCITDTGTDFGTLVHKLGEYFSAQNNVVLQRYLFRQCIQLEGESVDSWHGRLRIKVRKCEYGSQTDSIIRDQIVACCYSSKLRRMLVDTPNISLQEALKTARSFEATEIELHPNEASEKNGESENNNSGKSLDKLSPYCQRPNLRNKCRTEPDLVDRARKQGQQQTRRWPALVCGSEVGDRMCDKNRGKTCLDLVEANNHYRKPKHLQVASLNK